MKYSKTIAALLTATMLFGSSVTMTGCYSVTYSRSSLKKLESECKKIAKEYCDDSGYDLKQVKAITKAADLDYIYLTNYCEFDFLDGKKNYGGIINVDTGEIYTTEHIEDFCEAAQDFIKDELDILAKDIDIRLRLDNLSSKYVSNPAPTPYIENRVLPVELDSYDEYIDYLSDSDKDDDLCLLFKGHVDDSFELFELGYEYRQEIRDEYGLILNMNLENDHETYFIDNLSCTSSVFAPIDVDDIHLLVEYKNSFSNSSNKPSIKEFDVDELASRISVSQSEDGLSITLDEIDGYNNKFRIVAYEGDEILDIKYKDGGTYLTWEARDDGSYVSSITYRFDEEYEKK